MEKRNEIQTDSNKTIVVLFVLFLAIVLRDATIGTLSFTWVVFMGAIVIGLSLSVMLNTDRKGGDKVDGR